MAEPAAGLLDPELSDRFSSQYVKRIVEAVQDDSFIVIAHNCGQTTRSIPSTVGTKVPCIHVGNAVDMLDILPQVPDGVLVCGNVDPARVFRNETTNQLYATTMELLNATREYRNFVHSPGCGIPAGAPLENIDALYQALSDYNAAIEARRDSGPACPVLKTRAVASAGPLPILATRAAAAQFDVAGQDLVVLGDRAGEGGTDGLGGEHVPDGAAAHADEVVVGNRVGLEPCARGRRSQARDYVVFF